MKLYVIATLIIFVLSSVTQILEISNRDKLTKSDFITLCILIILDIWGMIVILEGKL